MQRITAATCIALLLAAAGCVDCIDKGNNKKVPDAGPDEYTLIMDNGLSRELPVYVDEVKVATICGETGDVRIGNFKVNSCSKFKVFDEVNQCWAPLTPCGGLLCHEVCSTYCFDTTTEAGQELKFSIQWADNTNH
jgi:hypothetical protein